MNIKMTLREALQIQAQQIEHYQRHRSDLAGYMASITRTDGMDLDVERPISEINLLVPRGSDIEYACSLTDQGA